MQALAGEQVSRPVFGDGQGVAVALVAEHRLTLVVGAPESVGLVRGGEFSALGLVTPAPAALDEAVTIKSTAWTVLTAGGLIMGHCWTSLSRILGAPQEGCSRLIPRMLRST